MSQEEKKESSPKWITGDVMNTPTPSPTLKKQPSRWWCTKKGKWVLDPRNPLLGFITKQPPLQDKSQERIKKISKKN